MKSFIRTITVILALTLMIAAIPTESEAKIYEDTIRLHILANSDSDGDQELKIKIRDKVLEKYGDMLSDYSDIEEAKSKTEKLLQLIKDDVDSWLSEMGAAYTSTVTLGDEWYETREYDGFTLPRGNYTSLRILIGEGEGQNWWCVMFPPICQGIAIGGAVGSGYTSEEEALITSGKYSVKFKVLELISDATRKVSKRG